MSMFTKQNLSDIISICEAAIGTNSKIVVDSLEQILMKLVQDAANKQLTDDEIRTGQEISKVSCIKAYRNRTGFGLMECKRFVEKYFDDNGLMFYKP